MHDPHAHHPSAPVGGGPPLSGSVPREELGLLEDLATRVGQEELLPRFGNRSGWRKGDGSLVTEADGRAQERILEVLDRHWPGIPALGEESPREEQTRILARGGEFWCVDPLDGTSNFDAGMPFYAVSVALMDPDGARFGVVHDPSRKETFAAARGEGAWLNGTRLEVGREEPPALDRTLALVDFKRLDPLLSTRLAQGPPYRSQRSLGAVALDWCWLAAGRCHLYLHGRQALWDYAAAALILREAGGAVCLETVLGGGNAEAPTLDSRVATGATHPDLLREWRRWLLGETPARDRFAGVEVRPDGGGEAGWSGGTSARSFHLRAPAEGDLGWLVQRHGSLYAAEYAWGNWFEGIVAAIVSDYVAQFDPARDRVWIAERGGAPVGSVMLVHHPDRPGVARLRVLLVEPSARGLGVGRALVRACTTFAREAGYHTITLWTNSVLDGARRLYQAEGYRMLSQEPTPPFPPDQPAEVWELEL